MKKENAFTLVEIMIVMSIIAVIMGFLVGATIKARQKGKITKTQATMNSIAAALRMYQDDFGAYPPNNLINRHTSTVAGSAGECLYYYLGATFKSGVNSSINAGPYLKFSGTEVTTTRIGICDFDGDGGIDDDLKTIDDAWGKELHYRNPAVVNINSYDLYSEGANKTDNSGSGDDINNWE